ncbi:hypothetical protein [Acinetobacter sp.]|uniref:hypothetical protein n=1 Tax=Acinetobacter sp. TaxID=472 RepID=UPI000C6A6106|nr:hypothetical protein [Acinetobacter sp.]MBC69848.1 hypothetical protein [Acinetobacter sp.]|tara:strand:+ start:10622 stop:11515 length:894 start_codon:yes stop_codon:yes gene_type:complete
MIELHPNLLFAVESYIENNEFIDSHKFSRKEIYNSINLQTIKDFLVSIDCWNFDKDKPHQIPKNLDLSLVQDIFYQYLLKNSESIKWLKFAKKGNIYLKELKDTFMQDYSLLEICGIFNEIPNTQEENLFNKIIILSRNSKYDFEEEFQKDLELLERGRRGEKYSKIILEKRHNQKVIQYHFEDNDKGYDLYQKVGFMEYYVEVKTSYDDIEVAFGTFSRNQINKAKNINNQANKEYLFHFWNIHENKICFAEIDVEKMLRDGFSEEKESNLIPKQKIKFKYFKDDFVNISSDVFSI